jgi:hypothetical protein
MISRDAMFFLCDDVLVALSGKMTIAGMYTSDIIIPNEGIQIAQLVAVFTIRTPMETPFQKLVLQISMPGEENPQQIDLSGQSKSASIPGRTTLNYKLPFLIGNPILHSGPIEAKVIHESGEMLAGRHWVTTLEQAQVIINALA